MSLRVCLAGMVARGELDRERADHAGVLFDSLEQDFKRQMGDQAAAAMATDETLRQLKAEAFQRRRQTVLQIAKQADILRHLDASAAKGIRRGEAVRAVLDAQQRAGGFTNVEALRTVLRARAFANMAELVTKMRRGLMGHVGDPALLSDVVREAFGEDSGNASARILAKAWAESAEWLRLRFNAAGGAIPRLDGWGLPQGHDQVKVGHVPFAEWRDFIVPKLDTAKMVDEQTGRPFSGEALEVALRGVYDTIRTDGMSKLRPGQAGGAKLANRRLDHRFLKFASADDWLAYQDRFGAGDAWAAMTGHVDGMARDVAAMEVLGPNPEATVKWLGDTVKRDAAIGGDANDIARARNAANANDLIWRAYKGDLAIPGSERLARVVGTLRAVQGAAKLGSAPLTAVTDLAGGAVTRLFNGLPLTNMIGDYVKGLSSANAAHRAEALGSALIVEDMLGHSHRMYQAGERSNLPAFAQLLANGTHRVSGLEAMDRAGEQALGMDFMRRLAQVADRPLADLDAGTRGALDHYGIGADGWDIVRATEAYDHHGVRFLRPDDVGARTDIAPGVADALTNRLLAMIQGETRYVVPKPSLTTRAQLTAGTQPGTVGGEIVRSAAQFKSFIFSIMREHGGRMVAGRPGGISRAQYAATYTIGATLLGALAMQLRAVAKGEDPRDMTDLRFWGAAVQTGGALNVAGDFLFTEKSRAGDLLEYASGPLLTSFLQPLKDLTLGNIQQAEEGKRTNAAREAVKFVQNNTPGSTLWYGRLAFQREVIDQLQRAVDPQYAQAFARTTRRAAHDFHQNYYWAPGETAPDRAPDLAAVDGGSQ